MVFGIQIDPKKKKKSGKLPLQADPNHKQLYKIGKEYALMKKYKVPKERIEKELGKEALKYNKIK